MCEEDRLVQITEHGQTQDDDEISLVDAIKFFLQNGKFISLTTAGLSAIAISFSLLQPKPAYYQKQLTLSLRTAPVPVSAFPSMDDNQASTIAVKFLEDLKLDRITAQTKYDPATKQIDLTLQSTNTNALNNVGSTAVRQVETGFEQIMDKSIGTTLSSLETQIQRNKRVLDQLKQQSAQFSPTNEFRLGATEIQRTQYLAALTALEFDKQYLEQSKKNLTEFTTQVISVQLLAESDKPPQSRSLMQVAVIAVIASFIIAVLAAIIRAHILRLQNELSQQKPQDSSGV
jgi:hypothetical protein